MSIINVDLIVKHSNYWSMKITVIGKINMIFYIQEPYLYSLNDWKNLIKPNMILLIGSESYLVRDEHDQLKIDINSPDNGFGIYGEINIPIDDIYPKIIAVVEQAKQQGLKLADN